MMVNSRAGSDSIYWSKFQEIPKKDRGNLLYYTLMILIVIGLVVGIILVGGMVRFTLAIFTLFIIGFNLLIWSFGRTEHSQIWRREKRYDEKVNLKLKDTSNLVERAFKGMELSQALLEKEIRNLYLDKLRENRNLSMEELEELLNSSEKFRQVVDDEIISDFILSKKEDVESSEDRGNSEYDHNLSERLKGEGYEQWISTLLKHIEEWE